MLPATAALDHLLIGTPDLGQGIEWLEARTGVRAIPGGVHPGLGTWNALASLGPSQYVEIIAPDPAQSEVETFYVPGLRDFKEPRIATWAARGAHLASRFASGFGEGFQCDPPRQGSRLRPDGTRLAWTLAFPKHLGHHGFSGLLPFLIEWESRAHHPGQTTPNGLSLQSVAFGHPEPEALRAALAAFAIEALVVFSPAPFLEVDVQTPKGGVTLR